MDKFAKLLTTPPISFMLKGAFSELSEFMNEHNAVCCLETVKKGDKNYLTIYFLDKQTGRNLNDQKEPIEIPV